MSAEGDNGEHEVAGAGDDQDPHTEGIQAIQPRAQEPSTELVQQVPGTTPAVAIEHLVVSPTVHRQLIVGRLQDLQEALVFHQTQVQGLVWNESGIQLLLGNSGGMDVIYRPAFHPASEIFFQRQEKQRRGGNLWTGEKGTLVWEGLFEPVQFKKMALVKFLKTYSDKFPPELRKKIHKIKVNVKNTTISEQLSEDHERTITEQIKAVNLPSSFSAVLPLFGNIEAELNFELTLIQETDHYDRPLEGKYIFQLVCTNVREALRDVWDAVLQKLPSEVPRYYGQINLVDTRR